MKTRFQKHVAHYTLAMIGLGLSALTHAADAPAAKSVRCTVNGSTYVFLGNLNQ